MCLCVVQFKACKTETNSIIKRRVKRYLYITGTVDTVLEHPLLRSSTSIVNGIEVNSVAYAYLTATATFDPVTDSVTYIGTGCLW